MTEPVVAVVDGLGLIFGLGEYLNQSVAETAFVLDHKYSHIASPRVYDVRHMRAHYSERYYTI